MSQTRYGVVGVGEIAEAIVTGLCRDVRDAPRVLLSPRGARRAAELADRHPSVTVAPDNQTVVDRSETVLVTVRPDDARDVLGGLAFRRGQSVISAVAGLSVPELVALVTPAREIARAIPLPAVAERRGPTPVQPPTTAAIALFERLGGAIGVDDADALDAMSATTATIAAHYAYVDTVAQWLAAHGVARDVAARYVTSIFAGVGAALARSDADPHALSRAHMTPGGINEQFASILAAAGVSDVVDESLDQVLDRLRAGT